MIKARGLALLSLRVERPSVIVAGHELPHEQVEMGVRAARRYLRLYTGNCGWLKRQTSFSSAAYSINWT